MEREFDGYKPATCLAEDRTSAVIRQSGTVFYVDKGSWTGTALPDGWDRSWLSNDGILESALKTVRGIWNARRQQAEKDSHR